MVQDGQPGDCGDAGAKREMIRREKAETWESHPVLAQRLGVSRTAVEKACKGMRPPPGVKIVGHRVSGEQGRRTDLDQQRYITMPEPVEVEIPAWVPSNLHGLYETLAERDCEQHAASVCRRLKHGASIAFV